MPMPPQLLAALQAKKGGVGKPKHMSKPSKGMKKKKPIGPSNNTILQAIGRAGGADKKVPPFI